MTARTPVRPDRGDVGRFCPGQDRTAEAITTGARLLSMVLLLVTLLTACSQPQPRQVHAPVLLRLSGSTSMQPLLHDLAEAYSQRYPYVSFDSSPVGSSAGLEALRRGNADLALVSRSLRREEEYDIQTGQRLVVYSVIAQDGIAILVHESNHIRELSLYQVRNIFDGQTATWEELGGPTTEITVVSREDGSGTRSVFEETVMYGRRVTPTAVVMPGSDAVRDYVATHEGAIGYLSMGYAGPGVSAVAIDQVRPELRSVQDDTYLITRPFLLVSQVDPDTEVQAFMEFSRSPAGQAVVGRVYGHPR
jgi:phosphate transport system substrate-binding protein